MTEHGAHRPPTSRRATRRREGPIEPAIEQPRESAAAEASDEEPSRPRRARSTFTTEHKRRSPDLGGESDAEPTAATNPTAPAAASPQSRRERRRGDVVPAAADDPPRQAEGATVDGAPASPEMPTTRRAARARRNDL